MKTALIIVLFIVFTLGPLLLLVIRFNGAKRGEKQDSGKPADDSDAS